MPNKRQQIRVKPQKAQIVTSAKHSQSTNQRCLMKRSGVCIRSWLTQLDFHIKSWKSDLIAITKERPIAYFYLLKPPMMEEAFQNEMDEVHPHVMNTNRIMLKHMIKHNELIIELCNFVPLCTIKPPIFDKAHRMYRINKHERWDTFRCHTTNVRYFCVTKQESDIVNEHEFPPGLLNSGHSQTFPKRYVRLPRKEVLDQIEVPMRDLSCTPVGPSKKGSDQGDMSSYNDQCPSTSTFTGDDWRNRGAVSTRLQHTKVHRKRSLFQSLRTWNMVEKRWVFISFFKEEDSTFNILTNHVFTFYQKSINPETSGLWYSPTVTVLKEIDNSIIIYIINYC